MLTGSKFRAKRDKKDSLSVTTIANNEESFELCIHLCFHNIPYVKKNRKIILWPYFASHLQYLFFPLLFLIALIAN